MPDLAALSNRLVYKGLRGPYRGPAVSVAVAPIAHPDQLVQRQSRSTPIACTPREFDCDTMIPEPDQLVQRRRISELSKAFGEGRRDSVIARVDQLIGRESLVAELGKPFYEILRDAVIAHPKQLIGREPRETK